MAGWDYDCVIIGGGPGGLVAALYLRRFRRKVLVINQGTPRAAWIPKTHNLIGYDRGISGRTLLARLHSQLDSVHTERINNSATVLRSDDGFSVELEEGSSVRARKVILATGMEDVHPKIDNVVELRRKGLLRYCSICDGYEYRNQHLAVLAQDDAGLAKALFSAQLEQKRSRFSTRGHENRTAATETDQRFSHTSDSHGRPANQRARRHRRDLYHGKRTQKASSSTGCLHRARL